MAAAKKGGRCLDDTFNGIYEIHRFVCSEGHEFDKKASNVLYSEGWCKLCEAVARGALHRASDASVRALADLAGYDVVGPYRSVDTPTELKHRKCGLVGFYKIRQLQRGTSPCKECWGGEYGLTQSSAERYAKDRNGVLIQWSIKIKGRSTWCCDKGHEWNASWSAVRSQRSWCNVCRPCFMNITQPGTSHTEKNKRKLAAKSLDQYKRTDKKKGQTCDLVLEDIIAARSIRCSYCNRQASGLDRIDNTIGHTRANTVPSCVRCNWVRGSYLSFDVMVQVGRLLSEIDP